MTLKEERLQILKMLEEGKITAEQAANLLAALETGSRKNEGSSEAGPVMRKRRWIRIRVTDGSTGRHKVNVNLPFGMVNAAMRLGTKFVPEMKEMDMDEFMEALRSDAQGKIVDVHDEEDGEHVEIFVE